jgi:hypothetical protein
LQNVAARPPHHVLRLSYRPWPSARRCAAVTLRSCHRKRGTYLLTPRMSRSWRAQPRSSSSPGTRLSAPIP